jgi:outer membrane lipoprotein-sorting protein
MISAFALAAVTALSVTEDVDAFLKDFAKKRDEITTFQCRYSQSIVSPDDTLETEGTLVFVRPKRILFRYDDPKSIYMIDDTTFYEYDPDATQLRIETVEGRPEGEAFFLAFEKDLSRLKESYTISLVSKDESKSSGTVLELVPKSNVGDELLFNRLLIFLREDDYLPYRLFFRNASESDVTFELSDYIVNDKTAKPPSTLDVPEGTTILRGDAKSENVGPGGKTFPELAPKSEPPQAGEIKTK